MKTFNFGDTKVYLHKSDLPDSLKFPKEVAVDSETTGLSLVRDRLCLLQIATSKNECHLIKFEKPSILVPFKFSSENHQHFNAKFLQENFCSKLIEEDNFNEETFVSTLRSLSQDNRILVSMKSNFKNVNVPDTLSIISNFIMEKKYAL